MPDPNDYPRIQFNATAVIDEVRKREQSSDRSENIAARRDLERYYALLDEVRPAFTEKQAQCLCDIFNGTLFEPIEHAPRLLWMGLDDAQEHQFQKWDVDKEGLVQRVADLSFAEALATIDAIERFWNDEESSVVAVGLCGSEAMRN